MTLRATLHGGPSGGKELTLRGVPPGQWPDWTCVKQAQPTTLPHHYRHIAGGVYEYQGACAEFDHDVDTHQARCADCGSQILGHPEKGHKR